MTTRRSSATPLMARSTFTNGVRQLRHFTGPYAIEKKAVVGVVYNPLRGDLFTAIKGQGSYLTKITGDRYRLPMRTAPLTGLDKCLIAIEWGNQRKGPNWQLRSSVHNALLTDKEEGGAMCKSVRSNGSAALDFCYVAQGVIDCLLGGRRLHLGRRRRLDHPRRSRRNRGERQPRRLESQLSTAAYTLPSATPSAPSKLAIVNGSLESHGQTANSTTKEDEEATSCLWNRQRIP